MYSAGQKLIGLELQASVRFGEERNDSERKKNIHPVSTGSGIQVESVHENHLAIFPLVIQTRGAERTLHRGDR